MKQYENLTRDELEEKCFSLEMSLHCEQQTAWGLLKDLLDSSKDNEVSTELLKKRIELAYNFYSRDGFIERRYEESIKNDPLIKKGDDILNELKRCCFSPSESIEECFKKHRDAILLGKYIPVGMSKRDYEFELDKLKRKYNF